MMNEHWKPNMPEADLGALMLADGVRIASATKLKNAEARAKLKDGLKYFTPGEADLLESVVFARSRRLVNAIACEACDIAGLDVDAIYSKDRSRPVARARQFVMWRAHKEGCSLVEIGRALGRDHTTVRCGIQRIEKLRETPNDNIQTT